MIQEQEDPDSDADMDRRVRAIAKDLFKSYEDDRAGASYQLDADDICPLFNSIVRITDRYRSPELIGQGGMKQVYQVYDAKLARHVAMAKPLPGHPISRFDAFLREAHLTARLEHPGIIEVFDIGVNEQNRPFFTMEFKKGRSLRQLIREIGKSSSQTQHPMRWRLEIFMRICDAIAYAHSRRVLHLDIKPSNIQIGEFGEVKVCDWGLGVVMPDDEATDNSTALLDPDLYGPLLMHVKGTPAYMAPEQTNQLQPKRPTMDVYSLGCVLHELLTGEKYQKDRLGKKVAGGLSAIIHKAVALDPQDRYQSVKELHGDLSRIISHHSASVERPNLFREARLFCQRHREACIVVLGAAVLLAGSLGCFVYQIAKKEQAAVLARDDADAAKDLADAAKDLAEASLKKYRAKTVEAERLLHLAKFVQSRGDVFRAQDRAFYSGQGFTKNVQDSIKRFSKLVEDGAPPDSRAWEYLFWSHFLAQEFDAAVPLLDQCSSVEGPLVEAAQRFAPLLNEDGYLETDDFIDLLKEFTRRRFSLCARMMVYDMTHKRSVDDRVRIVCHWVRINNNAKKIDLSFDSESRKVRIRGPLKLLFRPLQLDKNYTMHINLLQVLDPVSLDLRETEVTSLKELRGLNLVEVDLRKTPVSNLGDLSQFRSIHRVLVEKGQFTAKQLKRVPAWVNIVVVSEAL